MHDVEQQVDRLSAQLEKDIGKYELLLQNKRQLKTKIKELEKEIECSEKAHAVIQEVAAMTQEQMQYHLSDLVSSALESVLKHPYEFKVEFIPQRGKIVAQHYFVQNGKKVSITGGGVKDLASLALRFTMWALGNDRSRTRNIIVLDEPLKWLKGSSMPKKGAAIIKEISQKMGVQVIMVSHNPELIESADNIIEVVKDENGVSQITQQEVKNVDV